MNQQNIVFRAAVLAGLVALTACSGGSGGTAEPALLTGSDPTDSLSVQFLVGPADETTDYYAAFDFAADDAMAYSCRVAPDAFSSCTPPVFVPELAAGNQLFEVQARAADGSFGATSTYSWEVRDPMQVGHADLVPSNMVPDPVEPNSWRGILRINCDFSHSSYNDPIVFPGQAGVAHLHRFYGQLLVDEKTNTESLISQGGSSCQGNTLNRTSYWVPALLAPAYDPINGQRLTDDNGEPAWTVVQAVVGNDDVAHEVFYYSAAVDDLSSIQSIPVGLKMIAGDAGTLPGDTQDTSIVRWHCQSWESNDANNPDFSATIPACVAPDRLRMDIFFPSCWNGLDLDSADHKSHMAYPIDTGGPNGVVCPDTHPVPLIRPSYHFAWGVTPDVYDPVTQSSTGWRLASDQYTVTADEPGGLSLHGDWFNGWHPSVLQAVLDTCIRGQLDCHDGNLATGVRLSGTQPGSQDSPAIINGGLGEHAGHHGAM